MLHRIIIFLYLSIFTISVSAQRVTDTGIIKPDCEIPPTGSDPCGGHIPIPIPEDKERVRQSSTVKGEAYLAIDGKETYSLTGNEKNPWWEVDLDKSYTFSSIDIFEAPSIHKDGFYNYYILTSNYPFSSGDLQEQLTSSCVNHIKVEKNRKGGNTIPMTGMKGQFLRIQSAEVGRIALVDVIPAGETEICGNGIDDDCDGLIDCEDPDCGVSIFNTVATDPTCSICTDGSISVQAFSQEGDITMNGINCNGTCILDNLGAGTYTVIISNGDCDTELTFTLSAPDEDESNCENGGFETGDFSNWTTTESENDYGTLGSFTAVDPNQSPGFDIIQSGSTIDPNLNFNGGTTLNSPTGGTFIGVLGDQNIEIGGADVYQMTNCFIVTASNFDFAFNYALVLEDPEHDHDEQPFFEWNIYAPNTGQTINQNTATAGTSFFDINTADLSVQNWSCVEADLSAFIGQEVCVEFTLSECGQGGHGAYAYIDAICQSSQDNAPDCDFELQSQNVCGSQFIDLILNNPDANNFTQVGINICDGNNCSTLPMQNGFSVDQVDIEDLASQAGLSLQDGNTYSVELTLGNDCGSCTSTQEFVYHDIPMSLDYPEWILVCDNSQYLTIPGAASCPNCTYEWSPAVYLDDHTTTNPMIDGTFNVNAFDQAYSLSASAEIAPGEFCTATATVNVATNPFNTSCEETLTYCTVDLGCTISAPFPIQPGDFDFKYIDAANGEEYPVLGVSINAFAIRFEESISRDKEQDLRLASEFEFLGNNETLIIGQSCSYRNLLGEFPIAIFPRAWRSFVPNAFSPDGNGTNDTFFPFFSTPAQTDACTPGMANSSVYSLKLEVYDRWGGKIHEKSASVPVTNYSGLTGEEVAWDGLVRCGYNNNLCDNSPCNSGDICYSNGEPVPFPTDVYTWVLTIGSCTTENCPGNSPCNGLTTFCSGIHENVISGDVTIVL